MKTCRILASAWIATACLATAQTTRLVPSQYPTIQQAINACGNGDTVLVAPGTYVQNINFLGKSIVVRSSAGAAATIIDGGLVGPVVSIINGEPLAATLQGFTIRNGQGVEGGGIRIADSSPTIIENMVTDNHAVQAGAGIYAGFSASLIARNVIMNNTEVGFTPTNGGGGICVVGAGGVIIEDNLIQGNTWGTGGGGVALNHQFVAVRRNRILGNMAPGTQSEGGGILLGGGGTGIVEDNLIAGNSAVFGAGINVLGSAPLWLRRNTIVANLGAGLRLALTPGAAPQIEGNIIVSFTVSSAVQCAFVTTASPVYLYNDVWTSSGNAFVGPNCVNPTGTNGNISLNPQFTNAAAGNYFLLPTSPCVDAGNPAFSSLGLDLQQTPRVLDGNLDGTLRVDVGALEFTNARLAASGAFQPGGTIGLAVTGTNGLALLFAAGSPSAPTQCPTFGSYYFALSSVTVFDPMTAIPASFSLVIPAGAILPPTLTIQALGVTAGALTGNFSNPVTFPLAP